MEKTGKWGYMNGGREKWRDIFARRSERGVSVGIWKFTDLRRSDLVDMV